eukprot:CAMPEP_0115125440 /NCGR_PEP_ID=MMETSP0227-20121206/49034_1 /TAXON_ID=89957 /ORGANISM="Polarella glacialis, Strain CCMP 1383" /LENGTH=240 /DNA_ID=CAMNT_0002528793 /DNA_START=119 /DNA_END=841 /DNA_ORIENTATION=-
MGRLPPADVVYGDFKSLKEATKEEWDKSSVQFEKVASCDKMAERALAMVEQLKGVNIGNLVDQHEHAMQTATRALRDGADEETVVVAVLHDIGEIMTPINHGEVAGALLRPYISPENYWILMHHEVFQAFYYQDAAGLPEKNARDMLRSSPHFDACERFCNDYDQPSFDPDYESLPLEHFAPMVRRVFAKTPYWHADHEADSDTNKAKMRIMGAYPMPDEPDPSAEPAAKKAKVVVDLID